MSEPPDQVRFTNSKPSATMSVHSRKSVHSGVSVHSGDGQMLCSICRGKFDDMILSSCFHSFCQECLKGSARHSRAGQFMCPICNTPVNTPPSSAGDLLSDSGYTTGGEPGYSNRQSGAACDICGTGIQATHQCLQCIEKFCASCTNAHLKMKASRYHGDKVVPLRAHANNQIDSYCPRHRGQKILFFCKKCDVVICNVCKLLEHENHVTKLVSEEASDIRNRLSFLLRNQSHYVDNLQDKLRKANTRKYQYPYELEQEIEKVRQQATKMHLEIEREKTDSERELEQHYNGYISKVNDSAETLRDDYDQRSSLMVEAHQLLNSENDLSSVLNGGYICKQLEDADAERRAEYVPTPEPPYKKFVPRDLTELQSQKLVGMVTDNKSNTTTVVRLVYADKSEPPSPSRHSKPDKYDEIYSQRSEKYDSPYSQRSEKYDGAYSQRSEKYAGRHSQRSEKYDRTHSQLSEKYDGIHSQRSEKYDDRHSQRSEKYARTHSQLSEKYDGRHSQRSSERTMSRSTPIPAGPIQITKLSEFYVPFDDICGYVYGIAPIAGQQLAWVTLLDHDRLFLVDKDGNIENAVEFRDPCEGVTSDSEGGCYVTCPRSRSIHYVDNMGKKKSVVLDLNMDPHGMAGWQYLDTDTRKMIEELYICFTDSTKRHTFEKRKGYVGVFSFFGQDLGKAVSVQSPVRIDVDLGSRMLCIADHENGCVMICNRAGNITTGLYTGEENGEAFKPLGVCFDHTGHVIVTDWAGGKVSRISQDGTLVQHLLTGMDGPQSVAMGDNGMLWIGEKMGKISVYSIN